MALFLEIMDGELKGTRTPVRDGLTIGRKQGLLTIRDSKLSSKHAVIQARGDGSLWIVDLGSSNAIKTAAGRVRELLLFDGVVFILGKTKFMVFDSETAAFEREDTPTPAIAPIITRSWIDLVRDLAERSSKEARTVKRDIAAFDPAIRLRFTRGIQAGTEWTIGYGPRVVGSASLDLTLDDVTLPDRCFRLLPQSEGVLLKTEAPDDVKLNGKYVESQFLKHGDVIDIKSTQIQIVLRDSE
jgi:hypothetical protein